MSKQNATYSTAKSVVINNWNYSVKNQHTTSSATKTIPVYMANTISCTKSTVAMSLSKWGSIMTINIKPAQQQTKILDVCHHYTI